MGGYRNRMERLEGVLSRDDMLAALGNIKSTWPAEIVDRHNQINKLAGTEKTGLSNQKNKRRIFIWHLFFCEWWS